MPIKFLYPVYNLFFTMKDMKILKGTHEAQLLTYMKLTNIKQGFLINLNEKLLKQGLNRLFYEIINKALVVIQKFLHVLHALHALHGRNK